MNKKTYLLIDTSNLFFRARHGASRQADTWGKIGMAIHITLMSANKMAKRFNADHVIFALEGRSWRKDYYAQYKANRAVKRAALTEREQEEDQMFWETYDSLNTYLKEKTNCSVIREANAEADDIIARWIHLHPNDDHIIVSSDSDFHQLLSTNVRQYNGITDELWTLDGVLDDRGNLIVDKKTGLAKHVDNPEWILFLKAMRGDSSDNVFSAYPGVRVKGTKNKVGLTEAFADRERHGYAWSNIMLSRWTDPDGVEHRVKDDYERNVTLIDLTAQPQEIKDRVDQAIIDQVSHKEIPQVGTHFLRFCGKYDLVKMSENAEQFGRWLNQNYRGALMGRISEGTK